MADWYRRWHGTEYDAKWRTISRLTGQEISRILAVWDCVLESASANTEERGRMQVNAEDVASALDITSADVEAVLSAMQGRVLDGDLVINWRKRQPLREDTSSLRVREYRERNAMKRNETQGNAREEEIREEKNKRREEEHPPTPLEGGVCGAESSTCGPSSTPRPADTSERDKASSPRPPAGERTKQVYSEEFERFWVEYPNRKSKGDACKAWEQLRRAKIMPPLEILTEKIKTLERSPDWTKQGGRFIPHPATWLRRHGWNDEVDGAPEPAKDSLQGAWDYLRGRKQNGSER